jgi:hypothetical protein
MPDPTHPPWGVPLPPHWHHHWHWGEDGGNTNTPTQPSTDWDFAFQLGACLNPVEQAALTSILQNRLATQQPQPDVRFEPTCSDGTQRGAIWMQPVPGGGDPTWRNQEITTLSLLNQGETVAFAVNGAFVAGLVDMAWNRIPKVYDNAQRPDPNGRNFLVSKDV